MSTFMKTFVAVLAAASFARATITIQPPNIIGNATNTITWQSSDADTDPESFSIELINQVFNSQFAVGNNIATTQGTFTFELPVVAPGDGYSIQFVQIGNINNIFAKTGDFAIQEHDADTPLPSTTASPTGGSSTATSRSSSSKTSSSTVTQGSSTIKTSSAVTSPIASPTAPLTTSAASTGATSSSASTTNSPSPSPSGAAAGLAPAASFAALIAGVLAFAL